jgi:hypothetical protein
LNLKTLAIPLMVMIVLLAGSIVVFNSRSFSVDHATTTDVVTSVQTNTIYVTETTQNDETSFVFLTPPIATVTQTNTVFAMYSTVTRETSKSQATFQNLDLSNDYILVGGQNGSWFTDSQFPRLLEVSLSTHYVRKLYPDEGQGTVWSGDFNGSDWLISGWGIGNESGSPNPYLYLYNGTSSIATSADYSSQAEWEGGDVFSISSNGSQFFVSGMGSGVLGGSEPSNHLSAGIFNGTSFIDLSYQLPQQMDGILYANAFGDNEWLVGGGYLAEGVLFSYNGETFSDLTGQISGAVPEFDSVQSIGWNGQYWLIGGVGFLAMYENSTFLDLTPELAAVLPPGVNASQYSVNSLAWNGTAWLIGGGEAVAINTLSSEAWLASFSPGSGFIDLSGNLPANVTMGGGISSILSIAPNPQGGWVIGGYSGSNGLLLTYNNGETLDLSGLLGDMNYAIWVGMP